MKPAERPRLAKLLNECDNPATTLSRWQDTAEYAAEKLVQWTPSTLPAQCRDLPHSRLEYGAADVHEAREALESVSRTPFLSPIYLRNLLGRQDAAEFLSLLRPVLREAGVPGRQIP